MYLQVYVVPIGGMCVRQKCAIGGSGSTYIYGHIDRHFKEGMNVDEIKQFVVDCKCIRPSYFYLIIVILYTQYDTQFGDRRVHSQLNLAW